MNYDTWRPFIAKFLAPLIGFVATLLKHKLGIEFSDAETSQVLTSLTDLVVFSISTGVAAVFVNKQVNPGNAASSHLAGKEATESQIIKVQENQRDLAAK